MTGGPDLVGVTLGNRYRIVRLLGEGGMGAVYEGANAAGQSFAVKVIHADVAAQMAEALPRFIQEARTSSTLTDRNVVSVVDAGTDVALNVPFLVMPLLKGSNVEDLIEKVGAVHPTTAVRIILQACRGFGAAHKAGIVHRDVKPANLFLDTAASGEIIAKVCDFGVARSQSQQAQQLTKTGTMMGSPLFMSPEQSKSAKHVDARSDVWSLGLTLYQMLTGVVPNEDATSLAELLINITTRDARPLREIAPWIDPGLAAAVHRTLVRDPAQRCPSMEAFYRAIQPFAGGAEHLTEAMLVGVPPEMKAQSASSGAAADAPPPSTMGGQDAESKLLGAKLAGKYTLARLLGKGGMGAVYEASDDTGKHYAVKVLLGNVASLSLDAQKRFVREARSNAAVKSPHAVAVIDADTDEARGLPFLVMELLSGSDLQQVIQRSGAIEPLACVRIFVQAARGLAAAHAVSLVHRDVKPANIFLHIDPTGVVTAKICDFGIAKSTATEAIDQTSAQLTKTGGMLGSPVYMSPEQAKNAKHVDLRTDIWSLCMAMYEALSGQSPWAHCSTIGELILAICTESIPSLADVAPWLDQGLADVVQRGLSRDATARWPSMQEFAQALEPFAQGSDRLTREMIASVAVDRRSMVAHRVPTHDATAQTIVAPPAARRSVGVLAAAGVALVALCGTGAWLARGASSDAPASATAEPTSSASAPPPPPAPTATETAPAKTTVTVRIPVQPKNARVQVDGTPHELEEGVLVLDGEPGDRFVVVATAGAGHVKETITILKGGATEPTEIVIRAGNAGAHPGSPAKGPKGPAPTLKTKW